MSNGMPWIRFHLYDWISGTDGMTLEQRGAYMTLLVRMYDKKAPIKEDFETLSRACNCSQKKFATIVEYLMRNDKLIEIDGGLWNTRVEEELKDFADKKDHISQIRSEAGKKGAQAKNNTKQCVNDFAEANDKQNVFFAEANDKQNDFFAEAKSKQNVFFAEANDKQNQAIKNQNKNNIYKKNKTIVLSKKEIDFEDLETTDLDDEPTEVAAVESQPEQIETIAIKQPLIHEQESVPKKTKRSKDNRGCRLPADFKPNLQYAVDQGLTHDEALLEFERFKLHWQDNPNRNAKKSDWQKAWYKWITHPEYGFLAKKKEKLEREKQYAQQSTKHTEQQRGWSYRVAQHMSNIKNSDSVYKFLFEDDNRTPIPLENRTKAIECRSGESYLVG
ncbi:YdaU family protein [Bartonella krasnovii]|uniref:YdaU family protein n=1 Tax=Bartonella krasnovii TaxID=2267275 RepID=UPI000E74B9A2|nr:YdaU family protein [Bartonella krasnovii]UNF37840.1 YdaU family protein [Bartonella krasnovii]UNF46040.1 YdaU family protein [Bartonella krasnovii]UNF49311.1 YdaU family protein [Bartonella krasnovii]UNF49362.1 YdaU family protein [Bartonella krasnovii]UNF52668.1 YdaU family protein [Bartonella krasnovii]